MRKSFMDGYSRVRNRIKYMAFGLLFGTGAAFLGGGGCIASGDCLSCGACATKLPILVLPILADSAILLIGDSKEKKNKKESID